MEFNELKLVNLSKQGNRQAFNEIVLYYQERVYLFMLKKARNEDIAREVTQVAWIKAWKKIKTFQKNSKFYTWICRIASNYFYDHYRKNKRYVYAEDLKPVGDCPNDDPVFFLKKYAHTKTTEDQQGLRSLCLKELREDIRSAKEKLSPEHKEVLELTIFEEMEYGEAADKIGCPVGTIMSRLYYARQHMQKHLYKTKKELEKQRNELS